MDISMPTFIVLMSATMVLGQRPFFAGTKPIGFPETPNRTTVGLGDRFGEVDGTTPKLPIEANGDLDLIDRLSKLPVDKQPFWFINWQAYEENRKNPQTYPQRPNQFIDPIPITNNANSEISNSNFATFNSNVPTSNSNAASTSNSDSTANRFGELVSNSDVKPVTPTSNENKNDGTNSGVKPATANSDSEKDNKLEQVIPLVPSTVEPQSTASSVKKPNGRDRRP